MSFSFLDSQVTARALYLLGDHTHLGDKQLRIDRSAYRALRHRVRRTSLTNALAQLERNPVRDDAPARATARRAAVLEITLEVLDHYSGATPPPTSPPTVVSTIARASSADPIAYLRTCIALEKALHRAEQLADVVIQERRLADEVIATLAETVVAGDDNV